MSISLEETYRAKGKLLITGEYLVLKGAKALAIPLKYGQKLKVKPNSDPFFRWEATTPSGPWFNATINKNLEICNTNHPELAQKLLSIIKQCINHRPDIKDYMAEKTIHTHLEFDKDWGWGSSSTLISCLAQWLGVNPYLLLKDTFGGSGYDIACATSKSPLLYRLNNKVAEITPVNFNPAFSKYISFVYTGTKQSSKSEIEGFSKQVINNSTLEQINNISESMLQCSNLNVFGKLMEQHESIIGQILQRRPVKDKYFPDFDGYIKSLGAWGGDFIMIVTKNDALYVKNYFNRQQLKTIFNFNDITG